MLYASQYSGMQKGLSYHILSQKALQVQSPARSAPGSSETILPAIASCRPEKARDWFILHLDNVPPHRALVPVRDALQEEGIEVLKHPPYSPDLAPRLLAVRRHEDKYPGPEVRLAVRTRVTGSAIYQYGEKTPTQSFRAAIWDLAKRWDRCVRLQGEFVEP